MDNCLWLWQKAIERKRVWERDRGRESEKRDRAKTGIKLGVYVVNKHNVAWNGRNSVCLFFVYWPIIFYTHRHKYVFLQCSLASVSHTSTDKEMFHPASTFPFQLLLGLQNTDFQDLAISLPPSVLTNLLQVPLFGFILTLVTVLLEKVFKKDIFE